MSMMTIQNRTQSLLPLLLFLVVLLLSASIISAQEENFYRLLGIQKNASPNEIKQAYRAKAREMHPDKHQGDPKAVSRFAALNRAYETLSDERRKREYDQTGFDPDDHSLSAQQGRQHQQQQHFGHFHHFQGGGHPFEHFFRGQQRQHHQHQQHSGFTSSTPTLHSHNWQRLVEEGVNHRGDVWLIQIFSESSIQSLRTAPVWESISTKLKGLVHCGRVRYDDSNVDLIQSTLGFDVWRLSLPQFALITRKGITHFSGHSISDDGVIEWVRTSITESLIAMKISSSSQVDQILEDAGLSSSPPSSTAEESPLDIVQQLQIVSASDPKLLTTVLVFSRSTAESAGLVTRAMAHQHSDHMRIIHVPLSASSSSKLHTLFPRFRPPSLLFLRGGGGASPLFSANPKAAVAASVLEEGSLTPEQVAAAFMKNRFPILARLPIYGSLISLSDFCSPIEEGEAGFCLIVAIGSSPAAKEHAGNLLISLRDLTTSEKPKEVTQSAYVFLQNQPSFVKELSLAADVDKSYLIGLKYDAAHDGHVQFAQFDETKSKKVTPASIHAWIRSLSKTKAFKTMDATRLRLEDESTLLDTIKSMIFSFSLESIWRFPAWLLNFVMNLNGPVVALVCFIGFRILLSL